MESILHGNAKTTPRIRKEIQNSVESAAKIAKRLGLDIKTVLKWKKASSVNDKRSGPIQPKSVLSTTEQQIICEFRRISKLPLDDIYIALKEKIPKLSRSNLHRCLKRHGLNVLPKEERTPERKKFKEYPIGLFILILPKSVQIKGNTTFLLRLTGPQNTFMSNCIQRCRLTSPAYF